MDTTRNDDESWTNCTLRLFNVREKFAWITTLLNMYGYIVQLNLYPSM